MADYTWARSEIRTRFREHIGETSTNALSNATADAIINDYYVNRFPDDAKVDEFDVFFTQALSATDDGEYTLSTDVEQLDEPVTIDGDEIKMYRDDTEFFTDYPDNEQYITAPSLAIGSSDTTKVLHSAFDYRIESSGHAYSKASSEITLSGDTIPQNKYGAFGFTIDADGDITVDAADDNDDGYDSPHLALTDLDHASSSSCFMGYLVVISTDSGGFIPGTTALDDSAVTDTYTDGKYETRNKPEAACIFGTKLYVRPKAYDIYQFKAASTADRPTAFSADTSTPTDVSWGPAIALGAAIQYLVGIKDIEAANDLAPLAKYLFSGLKNKKIKRMYGRTILRRH
jgi:hypothetical protein